MTAAWVLLALVSLGSGAGGDTELGVGSCNTTGSAYVSAEKMLIKCLMTSYDKDVRPAATPLQPVNVSIDLVVVKINDIREKEHVMVSTGWLVQEWRDIQLRWDPDAFGGTKRIRLPVDRIWTPDVVLYNTAADTQGYTNGHLAVINHTGHVRWAPRSVVHSFCQLDLRHFPFDSQKCVLAFGSWSYDITAVDIRPFTHASGQHMYAGKEWEIVRQDKSRFQWNYTEEVYPVVLYSLTLERTSSFYQYLYILPTVVLAFILLMVYFVPPGSGERITLIVGILLSCTLLLLMLEEHMPTEIGTVPVIASYLAYLFIESAICLVFTLLVSTFHFRDARRGKVPGWMRWIFLTKLNRLVCVSQDLYTALPAEIAVEESNAARELANIKDNDFLGTGGGGGGGGGGLDGGGSHSGGTMERTLDEIRRYLRLLAARSGAPEIAPTHRELVVSEWRQVARVIDRLMFYVFLIITVIVTIALYSHS